MRPFSKVITHITTVLFLGAAVLASDAFAQQKGLGKQLVGTWELVSSTSQGDADASLWGDKPKSPLVFADNGRYFAHHSPFRRPEICVQQSLERNTRGKQGRGAGAARFRK